MLFASRTRATNAGHPNNYYYDKKYNLSCTNSFILSLYNNFKFNEITQKSADNGASLFPHACLAIRMTKLEREPYQPASFYIFFCRASIAFWNLFFPFFNFGKSVFYVFLYLIAALFILAAYYFIIRSRQTGYYSLQISCRYIYH